MSNGLPIKRGIRQKEIQSHLNFVLLLWRKSLRRKTFLKVSCRWRNLTNVRFADGVALFNENKTNEGKSTKETLNSESLRFDLKNTQRGKVHDKPCRQ